MARIIKSKVKRKRLFAWLRDLERHKKTQHVLRKDDRYCCLGVACNTYTRMTGNGKWDNDAFTAGRQTKTELPPNVVSVWLGVNRDHRGNLVDLNDKHRDWRKVKRYIRRDMLGMKS